MVKMIDNYTLLQVVGEGNYGKVYRAKNIKTNLQYAIKIIPSDKLHQNSKLQQCTMNEVQTLTMIGQTQHIIMYYQMLKTKNNYYFVYEFCNGGTLMQLLAKQHHLQQRKAFDIFKQLLQAFKVLNRLNIMHRDLKPENIFFSDNKVKLGDFGFCKGLRPQENLTKTMLGSPIYMAPQVLKGQAYSTKADIWSLGVILYQMLYGVCPFQSSSIAMLINTINSNQIVLPTNIKVSEKSQQLLKKLLTKDYFRRIGWIELFNWFGQEENQQKQNVFKNTSANKSLLQKKASLVQQWANKNKLSEINVKQRSISQDVTKKDKLKFDLGSLENISPSNFIQKTAPFTPKLGEQNKGGQQLSGNKLQNNSSGNKFQDSSSQQKSYSVIRQGSANKNAFQAYKKPTSLPKRENSLNNQLNYGHNSCYKPDSSKKIFYSQNYQNIFSTPITEKSNKTNDKSIQLIVQQKQSQKDLERINGDLMFSNNSNQNRINQRASLVKNSFSSSRASNSSLSNNLGSKITKQLKSQSAKSKRKELLQIHQQCLIALKQTLKKLQQKKQKYLKIAYLVLSCVLDKLKQIIKLITIVEIDLLDISSLINYQIIQVDRMLIDIKQQIENNCEKIPQLQDISETFQQLNSSEQNIIRDFIQKRVVLDEGDQSGNNQNKNDFSQNISIVNMLSKVKSGQKSDIEQTNETPDYAGDDKMGSRQSKGQYYTTNEFAQYYKNLMQSKQKNTSSKILMLS